MKEEDTGMYEKFQRSEWFRRDRFGMFIHWGLYAIPARGEWVRSRERIPVEAYQPFFDTFDPDGFNPAQWARAAKEAGMKYAVMTAKHHDGFCLFDSALTDYKSVNTPAGRDLVREYLDAFRAEGIKVGLYYSLLDWHHPDYPHYGDRHHPMRENTAFQGAGHQFGRYLEYMHGQVRELCTNYGRLDILWFDFSYDDMVGEKWQADRLMRMVRELQPDVLVDNRLETSGEGFGSILEDEPLPWSGDFASPEQIIPPEGLVNRRGEPVPWEACITMNKNWGYCAGDLAFKPASMIVRKLAECVSKGGNLLLNVGPDARGRIPAESLRILGEVGDWMQLNGKSLYGCGRAELPKPEWGRYTQSGNRIYAHVMEPPIGPLHLPGIDAQRVKSIRLLRDGSEVRLSTGWMTHGYRGQIFADVDALTHDCRLPDPVDTVFEVECF
ncbi:MAG: alpha-L-fucosidase [Clostridia bacterium]|nr:alpha-L-fucosidase [Clostridia bacterium]